MDTIIAADPNDSDDSILHGPFCYTRADGSRDYKRPHPSFIIPHANR
jgi:hypothetical protein